MYLPSLSEGVQITQSHSMNVYTVPFVYIIPDGTEICDHDDRPAICRPLPPSTSGLFLATNTWNAFSPPEISISYFLEAVVMYSQQGNPRSNGSKTAVVSRPIEVLPYNDSPPPVDTPSYPGEFKLSMQLPVRTSFFGKQIGFIVIKGEEPAPLVYLSGIKEASTNCIVQILIHGESIRPQQLGSIAVEIRPTILTRTYYGIQRMECMPNRLMLTNAGPYLHTDLVRLPAQRFRDLQWHFVAQDGVTGVPIEACDGVTHSLENVTQSLPKADSTERSLHADHPLPWSWTSSHASQTRDLAWQTIVEVPISPTYRLYPSFCSELVARSYSIDLEVCIRGLYTNKMLLEVPLQVAYPHPRNFASQSSDAAAVADGDVDTIISGSNVC